MDIKGDPLLEGHLTEQGIPEVVVPQETRSLRFSFKHLDLTNEKFKVLDCCADFLRQLLERIKEYSNWTIDDFCDQNNNDHRHIINFPETSEPDGFVKSGMDQDQIAYHEAWQFELVRTEKWRTHGILIDDTFYVIWLDPDHRLYPTNDSN
jgi:hypothetical protein